MSIYKNLYVDDKKLITHDFMNDLANNDQYLFEELEQAAWGIQAWKKHTSNVAITASDTFDNKVEITSFTCNFKEGRTYRCNFSVGEITSAGAGFGRVVCAVYVGDQSVGGCISDTMVAGFNYDGFYFEWPFIPSEFGDQTVTCYTYIANYGLAMTATLNASATKPIQCWIDDVGTVAV